MNLKIKKNSYLVYKHTLLVGLSVCPFYQIKVKTGEPIGPILCGTSPQVIILRKIRRNFLESFTGKSSENVDSFFEEFLETHFEEPGARNFL